jgi:hypothetical protein
MPNLKTTHEVREAAKKLRIFIADAQRGFSEDSFEYKQLNDYYESVSAFESEEVEL